MEELTTYIENDDYLIENIDGFNDSLGLRLNGHRISNKKKHFAYIRSKSSNKKIIEKIKPIIERDFIGKTAQDLVDNLEIDI